MSPPRISRPINPMPDDVRERLEGEALMEAYDSRPPFQRNDYLGWINRAKRETTREKRVRQMLEELADGDRYMNMKWK